MNAVTRITAAAPLPENPWAQSLRGQALDLVEPAMATVDFDEIADTLAHIIRYAGCCPRPITVAQHTLIAVEAARRANEPPLVQAMVALHDAHEGHGLGDLTTPAAKAMAHIMAELYGPTRREEFRQALAELKGRHDVAINAAAGVPMPSPSQRNAIHHYDLVALATERRDFLSRKPRNWHPSVEAVAPLPRKQKWMPAPDAAEALKRAFRSLLPALRDSRGGPR